MNAGHLEEYQGPRPGDITIAVIGFTGHGKTSFIHHLTIPNLSGEGVERVKPGNIIPSTTMRAYRLHGHSQYGDRLVFIDTPGFEAGTRTRSLHKVVGQLKKWSRAYQIPKLSGILYLYSFNNQFNSTVPQYPYNQTPAPNNFRSLKALCYTPSNFQFMKWVWAEYSPRNASRDEVVNAFSTVLKERTPGATYVDFEGTQQSAWDIVFGIANQHAEGNTPAAPSFLSRVGAKMSFRNIFGCTDAGPLQDSEEYPDTSQRTVPKQQGQLEQGEQQQTSVYRSQTPSLAGTTLHGCA